MSEPVPRFTIWDGDSMTGEPRTCVWASEYDALTAKLAALEAALRHIGSYNKDARHMVEKGFHNTTLAIDLSDYANAALSSGNTDGAK